MERKKMNTMSLVFKRADLFVSVAKTTKEKEELTGLVSQTRFICKITKSTALHVVDAFEHEDLLYAVTVVLHGKEVPPKFGTDYILELRNQIICTLFSKKNPTNR